MNDKNNIKHYKTMIGLIVLIIGLHTNGRPMQASGVVFVYELKVMSMSKYT